MKRTVLFLFLCITSTALFSQKLTASLAVENVSLSGLQLGDEVIVPVTLVEKSNEKLLGFQLFINFDHKLFLWPATIDNPEKGFRNCASEMPFSGGGWMFNDNGNQFVALWNDPELLGIDIPAGTVLFDIVFIYKGSVDENSAMVLSWGQTYEIVDDKLAKGPTEVYDADGEKFTLTLIDGKIKK